MHKHFFTIILYTFNLIAVVCAQPYAMPLDSILNPSGNFAEIRSGHFHTGVDLKTSEKIGKPVHAIANGFIARIKIEPSGFGKVIYINHPSGITSVYAHLNHFNTTLAKLILQIQYQKKSFVIDEIFNKNQYPIFQNDIIAYSGNSGGSEGPHLHFELRHTETQNPLNPELIGFKMSDTISPAIKNVWLYEPTINGLIKKKLSIGNITNTYYTSDSILKVNSMQIGIGVELTDYYTDTLNFFGLYSAEVDANNTCYFQVCFDMLSYTEASNVNGFIDYASKINDNKIIQCLFLPSNQNLLPVKFAQNNGFIKLQQNSITNVNIKICDLSNNCSIINLNIVADTNASLITPDTCKNILKWQQNYFYELPNLKVEIPEKAFFNNVCFNINTLVRNFDAISETYQIGYENVAFKKNITLHFKKPVLDSALITKIVIVRKSKAGRTFYVGNTSNALNWISCKTKLLGTYYLLIDTTTPVIYPLFNFQKKFNNADTLKFKVFDQLSGVEKYNGYINNNWVLFEYDPKNSLLYYVFTNNLLYNVNNNSIKLIITDKVGNINEKYFTVKYQ